MTRPKANLLYKWRTFLWAAMHRKDFKECYIVLPVAFSFHVRKYEVYTKVELSFSFYRRVAFYIPYDVQFAYLMAQEPDAFNDIPF